MKPMRTLFLIAMTGMVVGITLMVSIPVHAQEPQPVTPANNVPRLSLVPLAIVNVGSGEIAAPVSSPTGASRTSPEFFLPRNGQKEITVTTSGGNVSVRFSNSVPPGVSANAFQWTQTTVPAGNAVGHLKYDGCASCPASFTLEITASSNDTVHVSVKINLTASKSKPEITRITLTEVSPLEPRFRIDFPAGTCDQSDTEVIGVYAGNLTIRLDPVASFTNFSAGQVSVIVPRLKLERGVQVYMRNPYGVSAHSTIELPKQSTEDPDFGCANCGPPPPPEGAQTKAITPGTPYMGTHINIGPIAVSGTDELSVQNIVKGTDTAINSGPTPCGGQDFIYTGVKATWIEEHGHPSTAPGSISISGQPPLNAPLRRPNTNVRMAWTLNAFQGTRIYQVVTKGAVVEGVCNDRVIH